MNTRALVTVIPIRSRIAGVPTYYTGMVKVGRTVKYRSRLFDTREAAMADAARALAKLALTKPVKRKTKRKR